MPKKSATRKTRHANQTKPRSRRGDAAIPLGVRHIFAALSKDGDTPSKAGDDAADVMPFARRIIAITSSTGSDVDVGSQLQGATRALYEDAVASTSSAPEDAPELSIELSALAGFYVGLATCWLLMTSINGDTR